MWRKVGETYLKLFLWVGVAVIFLLSLGFSVDKYDGFKFFQFIIYCGLGSLVLLFAVCGLGMFVEIVKHLESINQNVEKMNKLLEQHYIDETKM